MAFNSDYFNLQNWKITLPVDSSGGTSGDAREILDLIGYEHSTYFYDAPDHAMVFRANVDGATTSGSSYARSELREMDGDDRAAWNLDTGGTMTATLEVDQTPIKNGGTPGRVVVGQIHGEDHELVRLYYENGQVYFMNDRAGPQGEETRFNFTNGSGQQPNISLGERFSYKIDARGDTLTVEIFADGQIYRSVSEINSVWQSDSFYFKAGMYLGVNEDTGTGSGQASFYGLDFGHTAGSGLGGWQAGDPPPPPPPDPNVILGDDNDNQLTGTAADEILRGYLGNDTLNGAGGNDELWGNGGNDILIGGTGSDLLKGGPGQDTYVFRNMNEAGDTIADFSIPNGDRIDLSDLLEGAPGFKSGTVFQDGFIQLVQNGANVAVYVDMDGSAGSGQRQLLATLQDESATAIQESHFILPEDSQTPPPPPPSSDPLYLRGDGSANILHGGSGNDTIKGNGGNDTLYGHDGDDYMEGNAGNDILVGGRGADRMKGGSGTDTYVYQDVQDFGDNITEFRRGEKIDLSAIQDDFNGASGMSAAEMVNAGYLVFARVSSTKVNLYADLDGASGGGGDTLIAALSTESGHNPDSSIFTI